jgi:septum formation topological specificity factor MinE
MNKYLTTNILDDMSKVLSKYTPFSKETIFIELKRYKSIDTVLKGIILSLEQNISLENACYLESLPK